MTTISLGTARRKVSRGGPDGVEVPFQEVAIDGGRRSRLPIRHKWPRTRWPADRFTCAPLALGGRTRRYERGRRPRPPAKR